MIYIGIDIAKNTHFASAVNSDCEVIVKPFKFTNDINGFNLFFNTFKQFDISDCLVGLEATGIYGDNLTSFLLQKGFKVGCINPIQTDALRSSNIRKTKNDKIDTVLISKCLMLGNYTLVKEKDADIAYLRTLCRFKFDVRKSCSKAKIKLGVYMDIAFPELAKFFKSGLKNKSCYALLSKYPTAKIIAKTRIDSLTKLLSSSSKGHFKEDTAIALKELAKKSVANNIQDNSIQIKLLIEQIKMFQQQIDLLDTEISNIMKKLNSPILSIPGIGTWLGAVIISEIGDISRFSSSKKLLAFAGLDPSVRQSGNFNATNTRISKRGSRYLRYAITRAASLIIWNDDTFSKYYTTKLAQGKSHLNAVGHVANKLTRVIFHLLTTNTTFKNS